MEQRSGKTTSCIASQLASTQLGYSRKNPNRDGGEVEDMDFPGVLKKQRLELAGVN